MGRTPGLRKGTSPALLRKRSLDLVAVTDGVLRDVFTRADVMSEGMTREEKGELVYYGSTHILLAAHHFEGASLEVLARLFAVDFHLRVRVTRLAQREAAARAGAQFSTALLEVNVNATARGVEIVVDVVARLGQKRKTIGE